MGSKILRLGRILNPKTGRTLIIPMDHGLELGAIKGIVKPTIVAQQVVKGKADALLAHEGIGRVVQGIIQGKVAFVLKLTNATKFLRGNQQLELHQVERAIKMGADGVSVQVNIGSPSEAYQLKVLGRAVELCEDWGIPMLAMMYPVKSDEIKNPFDAEVTAHAARIGAEMGADIVKTHYTGSVDSFAQVVEACPVDVVVAGGPKTDNIKDILQMVKGAIDAGAAGAAIGRNAWQYEEPANIIDVLRRIVHDNISINEAMDRLSKSRCARMADATHKF
jgi:fructose-bisphosphate aldolase/2-amino-3,7-dideoxy-D-threo-hept-6-ulosonate synthase